VIPLRARDAKEPFFKHSILLVPQRKRKTETLMVVADARDAVFSPPVGPRASVLMGEMCPSIAVARVVLPDGCPLPIRDVWAPPLPVSLPLVVLVKAILLDCLVIRA
jgi:hypothetical protein